ncbi:MAG: DNA-3-methyladenine glycosylase [Deinococcales bacterium]
MRLERAFFARGAEEVARALLGQTLVHIHESTLFKGRIVESEAYLGAHDLACHASKGRTQRTEVMFGPPGHAYVYLIYGIHDMFNIVTGRKGEPQAVLIRALEPLNLLADMRGPGKLCRVMGIHRQHNGLDLCEPASKIYFESAPVPTDILATPRIGVDYAGDWKDAPLRFVDSKSPHLSRKLKL